MAVSRATKLDLLNLDRDIELPDEYIEILYCLKSRNLMLVNTEPFTTQSMANPINVNKKNDKKNDNNNANKKEKKGMEKYIDSDVENNIDDSDNDQELEIVNESKKDNKIVDKNSSKYKTLLKFLNKILINLNKKTINDLYDFKGIDRNDLIKDINIETFNKMEKEIFSAFDKQTCGWYRRKKTNNYILTFLRYACNDLNLKFTYNRKDIFEKINDINGKLRKTYLFYSIY